MITKRLIIRSMTFEDVDDVYAYLSTSMVCQHLFIKQHAGIEDTYVWMNQNVSDFETRNEPYLFVLEDRCTNLVIGHIELYNITEQSIEIGFMLNYNFWKKGFMSEALDGVINEVKKKHSKFSIIARCDGKNSNSVKLLQRKGFAEIVDFTSYELLQSEMERNHIAFRLELNEGGKTNEKNIRATI